jgi:hypothetical protein
VGRICDVALYDHCVTVSALSQHYSAAVATATATIGLDVPSSVAAALAAITPTSASAGDEEGVAGPTACCSASGVLGDVVASSGRDRSPVADPSEDVSVPADVAALSILSKLDDLVAGWVPHSLALLRLPHPISYGCISTQGGFFLIHRSHSISFTRAQGIPKHKIGFARGKGGRVGERLVEGFSLSINLIP